MSEAWVYTLVYLAWLAGAACFVLGLHRMNSPATGRSGNQLSAAGMTIAVVATLIYLATREQGLSVTAWAIIIVGFAIGAGGLGATALGGIADRWGLASALWISAVMPLGAFVAALFLPEPRAR